METNGCGSRGFDVPEFIFTQACNLHDVDYTSLEQAKVVSDFKFYGNMAKACAKTFGPDIVSFGSCMRIAGIYFIGVQVGGHNAYKKAQNTSKLLKAAIESENGNMTVIIHESDGQTYFVSMKENPFSIPKRNQ